MLSINWEQIHADAKALASKINTEFDLLIALQRGGTIPCTILSHILDKPMISIGVSSYDGTKKTSFITQYQDCFDNRYISKRVIFVDDLSDTGDTFKYVLSTYDRFFKEMKTASLYTKFGTKCIPDFFVKEYQSSEWLEFPWEV